MPNSPQRIQLLVLERIDAAANMARYYVLSIEPTLFGCSAMVRQWGRLGSAGQRRINLHARDSDARVDLEAWLARKLRRGYVIRAR